MRIFYASDTTPNSNFQSNIWRNNLLLPLIDLGHDVIEFNYDLRQTFRHLNTQNPKNKNYIAKNRPELSNNLFNQVKTAHGKKPVDLFFSYFFDACVLPQTIEDIKSLGIQTVNWYCNGAHQLHLVSEISPYYDWCLVPEKFRMDDYKNMGANPIYCQEAANPNIYKPYPVDIEYDVTFVGQAYGDRPNYIDRILSAGIDIRIWGQNWSKHSSSDRSIFKRIKKLIQRGKSPSLPSKIIGPVLSDEEMIKMYSRSKINLGFSTCGSTHKSEERILQVRLRDFEVPMSGGFYMVEYMEELEEFYEIGKEIVCYHNVDDLIDKIWYYLAHDQERESIRNSGYQRCLKDHSWHKRFQNAFDKMALN
ncbi:MAG: glycosyltransferase [Desulfobacteraceae bacterium]|nr:glycosyltransferase [Desulfobacteraceae bacterium]